MQFSVDTTKFKNEVNLLQGIAEKKSGVAALSSLLIETTENGIKMTGTDLDTTVLVEFQADIIEEGSICLPAKTLCDFIRALDKGKVKVATEENSWAKISCGTSKRRIAGLGKEHFPEIADIEADSVTIDASTFKALVQSTCFAITQEESRYVLNGAKVEVADGKISMVATDGHRISVRTETIDDIEAELDVLVPKKALTEVAKFISNEVVITDSTNHIKFESGDRVLISRKIVGNFPNYKMALPKANNVEVKFDVSEMIKSLRRVGLAADENSKAIKFEIEKNQMVLTAASNGEGEEIVKCKTTELPDEGLTVYLNCQYVVDFLLVCSEPSLKFKDGLSAVEVVDGNSICVIMPMRAN